ncbi:MAG: hypothetical protein HDR21_08450 [Lachnospiraceae bacterium]|nr:hypothetical protein [Lachnospiraceae bacterium]
MDSFQLKSGEITSKKGNMEEEEPSEQRDTYFPQEPFDHAMRPISELPPMEEDTSVNPCGDEPPLPDMNDLLEREAVSLDRYVVPENLKMPGKKIRGGPFAVHIVVGDLKGFGEITAGAKLAAELSLFYRKYPEWEGGL